METVEPQAQSSVTTNGTTEASTGSAPASPPPALASALSDLARSAEQVKDGEHNLWSLRVDFVNSL